MKNKTHSTIKYFDLYGLWKGKGEFLESHDVKNTKWQELDPKEPNFWFVPKDMKGEKKYGKFISAKDIFNTSSSGIKTHRDNFILDFSKKELERKLMMFCNDQFDDQFVKSVFNLKDTSNWKLSKNRLEFIGKGIKEELFKQYSYRPFDTRWIYYDKNLIDRPRIENIWNLNEDNFALIITKQLSTSIFNHSFVSISAPDICLLSLQTKESAYIFPLYLYNTYAPKKEKPVLSYGNLMLFDKPKEKEPNIKIEIIQKLSESYKKKIAPEEIFYYIYAILYSNIYRKKYNEFLKTDFPRVPFTKDAKLFSKISELGEELANLHLLKSEKLENDKSVKFPAVGDNKVEKREYKNGRIYINGKQYFVGVAPEVWNYHIGGYQVLDKWLKDRKDKVLSSEDINHYLKIIAALKLTIESQKEIDKIYPKVGKSL